MKLKTKLLYLAAFLVLALSLILTGNASAKYVGDASVQNGTTGGWDLPADRGKCITGIKSDGTMVIDDSITSRPDCIATTFPAYTTSAACSASDSAGANLEGAHAMVSNCVANDGTVISLKDLDRTASMCNQRAIAMGKTSGAMTSVCAAFTWTHMGPSLNGTDGFCYTTIRLDNITTQGDCPVPTAGDPGTGTLGYSWDSTNSRCLYSYGIQGKANAALAKKDGSGNFAAAGANVDLSAAATDTMGECLFNGASWSNHTTKGGTAAVATIDPAGSTIASPITSVRAGCLSCHNNTTQYNSVKGRWKSDYLKTGHKNMLRKATAGNNWAGPNADGVLEVYDSWGAGGVNSINWTDATTTVGGTSYPLMYIFGDWMAPAPDGLDVINWAGTTAKYNNGSGYSCAACHTTGWRNEDTTKGLCNYSSNTTQAACEAVSSGAFGAGVWTPSSGTQGAGIGGAEPMASFPGYAVAGPPANIPGITGQWDVDGIVCSRCHKVAYDPSLPINDEGVNAPQGFTTHETDIFDGWKCVQTCYGCHQSPAKTANGTGADVDLDHPENLPVKNSATEPAYVPEFSGHVLGGSFLNSPHGQFTGMIEPNSLGKYEIAAGTYASTFSGLLCRSNTAAGLGNILETNADGSTIKSKAECNIANGQIAGFVPPADRPGYWQPETGGGSCITCHNVHQSLFDADATEPLRRECTTCHKKNLANINHPSGTGTPLGDMSVPAEACVICHMPKATSSGFPMHLWRINADAAYRTFPTATEFGIGATATKKIANAAADGAYTNAVWVDVDYACGQCHGGSFGPSATQNGAPYISKSNLSAFAENMHSNVAPKASFTSNIDHYTVTLTDTSTDDSIFPDNAITVKWGDGTSSTDNAGSVFTHTYATAGKFNIVYKVIDSDGLISSKTKTVAVKFSITANISPALPSDAKFILKKNGITIRTGTGTASFVFSGLRPGTYKVKMKELGYTFDGDGVTGGNQNPITVIIGTSDETVTFTHTP